MPASNLATIFQPGILRHATVNPLTQQPSKSPTIPQAPNPSTTAAVTAPIAMPAPGEDPDLVKARIEADSREHKRSQEVLEFLILHQTSFELQLPSKPTKSAVAYIAATSGATGRSRSATPTSDRNSLDSEEEWNLTRAEGGGAKGLNRRGSERTDHRRLRRKKVAEAKAAGLSPDSGVRRSKTLPSGSLTPSARRQQLGSVAS